MAAPVPIVNFATQALVAQAKAEMVIALTQQFQKDINDMRDALERATKQIASLQTENARLKARLESPRAEASDNLPNNNNNNTNTTNNIINNNINNDDAQDTTNFPRPPPEGTIFNNGGPYKPSRTDPSEPGHLKQELNEYTQPRGYRVKILRSKLTGTRAKLVVSCIYAGRAVRTPQEEQARKEKEKESGYRFRKQRVSRRRDCPMRFILHEMIQDSGSFVVKHSDAPEHQRCNHEAEFSSPGTNPETGT